MGIPVLAVYGHRDHYPASLLHYCWHADQFRTTVSWSSCVSVVSFGVCFDEYRLSRMRIETCQVGNLCSVSIAAVTGKIEEGVHDQEYLFNTYGAGIACGVHDYRVWRSGGDHSCQLLNTNRAQGWRCSVGWTVTFRESPGA